MMSRSVCRIHAAAVQICAGALFIFGLHHSVPAADFLSNNSLEKYHGYSYLPGWNIRVAASAGVDTNPANAHTGNNSLKFDLSLAGGPQWGTETFAVIPGDTNRVNFWFRPATALSAGQIVAKVRWWTNNLRSGPLGETVVQSGIGQTASATWIPVTQTVVTPTNATFADLLLDGASAAGPAGLVFLDNFSFGTMTNVMGTITNASPSENAADIPLHAVLQWRPVVSAKTFHLYLGPNYPELTAATTNEAAFIDSIRVADSTNILRYALTLRPGTKYFWRADSMDDNGGLIKGEVLSFSTGFNYLENISAATAKRFDCHDHVGARLDAIQVIENPAAPGYIGVYHSYITNQFQIRLALSTNLLDWTFVRTLEPNGSMPALAYHAESGGFVLAHEQWSNPLSTGSSRLRFRYYASYSDLLASNASRNFLAPISSFHSTALEGTPNFFSISADGNVIQTGFHYYANEGVDRNARGTLNNLLSGSISWTTQIATNLNSALTNRGATANIGDRDFGRLFGFDYLLQEGQYVVGDFGTWRAWFYDYSRSNSFALFPQTPNGSRNFGNGTWRFLTGPNGKPAFFSAYFIFGEQAGPGEAGPALFYTQIDTAASELNVIQTRVSFGFNCYLRWLSGAGTVAHDTYMGTNGNAVAAATTNSPFYLGRRSKPSIDVQNLSPNTTYYLRVDEITADERITPGDVWPFSTGNLPRFDAISVTGNAVVVSGRDGRSNGLYYVLTSTNLTLPPPGWIRTATNQFDQNAKFTFTNVIDSDVPNKFYLLEMP